MVETTAATKANHRTTQMTMLTAPTAAPMMAHFLALSAADWASAYRPWAHSPDTLVEYTIDTIPSGRTHRHVHRTAQTRWPSGSLWPGQPGCGACGWPCQPAGGWPCQPACG